MEKSQLQLANEQELKQLRLKHEKLRRIITSDGFITEWYKSITKYKSPTEAFNQLNQFYYNNVEPPTLRYSNYNAFLTIVKRKKK